MELGLSEVEASNTSGPALASLLANSPHLHYLDLSGNQLTSTWGGVCESLMFNQVLQVVLSSVVP
jgi:Leucine-rich repeat (LRR) protein